MKVVSWNVNGIEACRRKGFLRFLASASPDIMCCQEIKTQCALHTPGYHQFWNPAKRLGYSGTLVLSKQLPLSWKNGMDLEKFDVEGRLITLEYHDYYVVNAYVPSIHPHNAPDRPDYRLEWDKALRNYIQGLSKPVLLCGDFNATRAYIDSYPDNGKNEPDAPFFRSDVRAGLEQLLSIGLVDAFRALNPNREGAYTWWGPKNKNRAENRGSRLDYFFISGELMHFVHSIKFHRDVLGSDHCPISMMINPMKSRRDMNDEDIEAIWGAIDWPRLEDALLSMQRDLSYAAYNREWEKVGPLQRKLIESWPARALAVRAAADRNTAAGVDGVKWTTDIQKGKAALSMISKCYRPLPYLYRELEENGKLRINLIPAIRDKAMQILYAYALDPVSEATADRRSFFARKGRSALDAHAYLSRDLRGEDAPSWVAVVDVRSFYDTVSHDWLLSHIPLDTVMLRKFLKAGMVMNGDIFPICRGMTMASSLSSILGNMMLDGLQSYLYDNLYPNGGVDYQNGCLTRFADDMVITARSRFQAEKILQIVDDFLAQRGLQIHPDKSFIADVYGGFDFLGRHYQKINGNLSVTPSDRSIRRMEQELDIFIMSYRGTQRGLIEQLNQKLAGWGAYHRTEDAYMEFRHIDAVVEGLLIKKMCMKYPRWHRQTVLSKFWLKDGLHRIFVLPKDHSVRVNRLAPLPIARHKPCGLSFNPYLDQDYQAYLKHRRNVQKSNGQYRGIWTRQSGRCAYCGQRMLADQEVELVEKNLGDGWTVRNLLYIHRQCAHQVQFSSGKTMDEHIDLFSMLDGLMDFSPEAESPYVELKEYFRTVKQPVVHLYFDEIERILGDRLPWEAFCFEAFWYDDTVDHAAPMWQSEGFPFHTFQLSEQEYNIATSWLSQGYQIKALHLESGSVTFRREQSHTSGIVLPRALTEQRLPDSVAYDLDVLLRQFIKDHGL